MILHITLALAWAVFLFLSSIWSLPRWASSSCSNSSCASQFYLPSLARLGFYFHASWLVRVDMNAALPLISPTSTLVSLHRLSVPPFCICSESFHVSIPLTSHTLRWCSSFLWRGTDDCVLDYQYGDNLSLTKLKVSAQLGVNTYTEEGNDLGKALVVIKVKLLFNTIKTYPSCVSISPGLIILI